jgi:sigma-B regulation protein RsbU (phosphoserine phosphatase)
MSAAAEVFISKFVRQKKMFPVIGEKISYSIYNCDGVILYSEFSQEFVGLNILDYVSEPFGGHSGGDFKSAFFPSNGDTSHISLLIKDKLFIFYMFMGQSPALASIVQVEGFFVIAVHVQDYYMERTKGRLTEDMTVLLDKSNNIIMTCASFRRHFVDKDLVCQQSMENYIMTDSWKELLSREEQCLQYLTSVRDTATDVWKEWKKYPEFNASDWIMDNNEEWSIVGNKITALPKNGNGVILFINELDQIKNDVRINLKARLRNEGTIGILNHIDVYKAGGNSSAPDSEGYSFSIRSITIGSSMQLLLKKDTSPVQDIVLPTSLLSINDDGTITAEVCFEKCGAAFSVFISGQRVATFFDIDPLMISHHIYMGLLASNGTEITNLKIETRPSVFDISKVPKQVCDVLFYKLPGRIFEARVGNFSSSYKKPIRYVYMKDVTHSRGLMEQLDKTVNKLHDELDTAKRIQTMLSHVTPPNDYRLSIATHYQPSLHVGGDLVDIKKLSDNSYAVIIYDVSGHGIGASLISAMAKLAFEHAITSSSDPAEILHLVNLDMCHLTQATLFLTAFIGIIDLEKMTIIYARAGHCLPEVLNNQRSLCPYALPGGGSVLGHSKEFRYESFTENILSGDRLFFYTDGLIEARNGEEVFYEKARMNQMLRSTLNMAPKLAAKQLIADVESHMRGEPFQDDVTFLIVDIK